jgi:hypothetical protein
LAGLEAGLDDGLDRREFSGANARGEKADGKA